MFGAEEKPMMAVDEARDNRSKRKRNGFLVFSSLSAGFFLFVLGLALLTGPPEGLCALGVIGRMLLASFFC